MPLSHAARSITSGFGKYNVVSFLSKLIVLSNLENVLMLAVCD